MCLHNGNSYEFRREKHGNNISPEARTYGSVSPSIITTGHSARFDFRDRAWQVTGRMRNYTVDGTAESIENALLDICSQCEIPLSKVFGFGSEYLRNDW